MGRSEARKKSGQGVGRLRKGLACLTHVPPQNSILVLLHFESSTFFWISSSGYPIDTTLTGSGYASPNTALNPGILNASARGISLA